MLRFNNLSIGTKLGIMSGLGILLALSMLASAIYGNSRVKSSNVLAIAQQSIVDDVAKISEQFLGVRLAVRNIRLAESKAEVDKLNDLSQRKKTIDGIVENLIPRFNLQANKERGKEVGHDIDQYIDTALSETVPTKLDALSGDPKDTGRIVEMAAKTQLIQHERLDPVGDKALALLRDVSASATKLATSDVGVADQAMDLAENLSIAIGVAVVLILLGSAILGAYSISKPIRRLIGVLKEIEKGNINIEIKGTERGDEIGSLAKAVVVIRASRDAELANNRIKTGLDVVRSNVMLSDDQYNIIYMNNSLHQMMREVETEMRKSLPNFDSSKLIGTNIDVFHKNPAHQRALLDKLTGSYETRIVVGTQKFFLVATAVMDKDGKRAGTVVEWRNETMEKAVEGEIDNIVKAAIAGDFSQRVPTEGKKEFMLSLATAMNSLCENIAGAVDDVARMLGALANGDLTPRITAEYQGAFARLKDDANATAEQLSSTIGDIKTVAREVNNASVEISSSTTDLSQRTEEQAASLEQTSASMEEISATVKKNAENAHRANQLTSSSRDVADKGGTVVADAVKAMARIEESSRKIADIIGVIDEIARQTNLLALNAAVEAARAGDAGRGFAVVASEVRSLAQRSSQAAKDIKDLITSSSSQVQDGVGLVNQAGTSLNEIVGSIKQVAEIVADIATASSEQAEGLEQINKALAQMDEVTQQNSALVEENAASAKALEHQSSTMDERVAFFKMDPGGHTARHERSGDAGREHADGKAASHEKAPARPQPTVVNGPGKPVAKTKLEAGKGAVARMQTAVATAFKQEPDWKEF
jgi:methyl-accepting chemotaxis protein